MITYATAESNIYTDLHDRLNQLLVRGVAVCDVGGGAHPLMSPETIEALGLAYSVLDVSARELEQAPSTYSKIVCDISGSLRDAHALEGPLVSVKGRFDVVFSVMMAEHIQNPKRFHQNVYDMLKPGGSALHVFPTLYTFPFIVNKLLPEKATFLLNSIISPKERHTKAKFPAYYRWCRGPMRSAIRRFEEMHWEVVEYRGYYGHGYYQRIPALYRLHKAKTKWLEAHPIAALTNMALLWLRKPLNV